MTTPTNASKRILVAEDDRHIALLMELALEELDVEVEWIANGAEALARLSSLPTPDGMVLDLMLPGLTGFEVLRGLRQNPGLSELPVLVVSARARDVDRKEALRSGATAFLAKPFGVEELVQLVAGLIGLAFPPTSA